MHTTVSMHARIVSPRGGCASMSLSDGVSRRALLVSSLALCGAPPRAAVGEDDLPALQARLAALQEKLAAQQTGIATPAETPSAAPTQVIIEPEPPVAVAPAPSPPPPQLAARPPPSPPEPSLYDFSVPFRGEPTEIKPFLGKANIVVNVKFDDPQSNLQMPGLQSLVAQYGSQGLHVLAFPTDQGWFEADDSNTLRIKFKQVYNFGQYPTSVVFDKYDLIGGNALPLYGWLTKRLANPWGVSRLVFDYEKFLCDEAGKPLRRYPRLYPVEKMEADVRAVLEGKPLPAVTLPYLQAWEDAKREATKSEYAFKPGLNYYTFGSPAS